MRSRIPASGLHFFEYLHGAPTPLRPFWRGPATSVPPLARSSVSTDFPDPLSAPFEAGVAPLCAKMLGGELKNISYPGGPGRASCRVALTDGRSAILTRRNDPDRHELECAVLSCFKDADANAPAPAVLGRNRAILLQEDAGERRLAEALSHAEGDAEIEALLDGAMASLLRLYDLADGAGLERFVPLLGADDEWLYALMNRLAFIGDALDIPCPTPGVDEMFDLLVPLDPRFVRWDARPGNAIIRSEGEVCWIDWEHCGARNRIDDLVWLLGDEATPDRPDVEAALLERRLGAFAEGWDPRRAHCYFHVYGVLHSGARLARMLDKQAQRGWGDPAAADDPLDKSGPSLERAQRLCSRAARWAGRTPFTVRLSIWFIHIRERLGLLTGPF